MNKDKLLIRNFIWNTLGSGINSFSSLCFLIIITRVNTLEETGIFSITFATASILYIFALYSGRSLHVTDIKGDITDKDYIISRVITSISTFILLILFVILNDYGMYKNTILILLCIWKILEAFCDVFYGVLQKNDELHKVGKSLFTKGIAGILFFMLTDIITKNIIYSCLSLCIVSIIVIILYDIPQSYKYIDKNEVINRKNIIKIYKSEFFIFANAFLTMFMLNVTKYAIEKYLTEDIQAIFGIILMPASVLPIFAQFVIAPIITKMTKYYKSNEIKELQKLQRNVVLLVFGFGIIAIMLGYLIGIPVLELLYNINLENYKIPFLIILLSYVFYAIGYVKTIIMNIFRKISEQFIIYVIVTITISVISYILVRLYNLYGAAFSYLISMVLYYILFYLIAKINCKCKEN